MRSIGQSGKSADRMGECVGGLRDVVGDLKDLLGTQFKNFNFGKISQSEIESQNYNESKNSSGLIGEERVFGVDDYRELRGGLDARSPMEIYSEEIEERAVLEEEGSSLEAMDQNPR
jgi:hypothetical protein